MAGFLTRQTLGRPQVTLKLATSLDGCIALASGESRWITGAEARAHAHLARARHEASLVGRGTWEADAPRLDEIGRAHVRNTVTNPHLLCRLRLEKNNYKYTITIINVEEHKMHI